MNIKYVKQLQKSNSIQLFFEDNNLTVPEGFLGFFEANNGGRPMQNICILDNGAEKVVNSFLSFNEEDKENVYKAKKRVQEDNDKIIPFATDPAGNYYCIKAGKIIFYSHEDREQIVAASSFEEFINNLK